MWGYFIGCHVWFNDHIAHEATISFGKILEQNDKNTQNKNKNLKKETTEWIKI